MSNKRRISRAHQLKFAAQDQDRHYFHTHPEAESYDRPATLDELKATGYPFGTQVRVIAVGPDLRLRAFRMPDVRQN